MTPPEFIRIPSDTKGGGETPVCPITGLTRAAMRLICVPSAKNGFTPAVPAKCLRRSGNLRGTWLVPTAQLLAYLHNLPTPGAEEKKPAECRRSRA